MNKLNSADAEMRAEERLFHRIAFLKELKCRGTSAGSCEKQNHGSPLICVTGLF